MQKSVSKSVYIKTFGCQMNVYDSNRMSGVLQREGFSVETDLKAANIILINTCSIRDKSEQKVLSLLGQLKPLKDQDPEKVIGVTGCVGQRIGRKLLQKVPHLDLVLGPDNVDSVGRLVNSVLERRTRIVETPMDKEGRRYSQPAIIGKSKPAEFLTIIKGCDHFCTYCIVPFVRGREKSRAIPEILDDVCRMVSSGTKEVTFLGQNINTFGKGTEDNLKTLIDETNRIPGLERIRYVTSHPRDLGMDLIEQFGTVEKLCPALHLPFQSGCDSILKRMQRLYTRSEYLVKVLALRKARPDICLSTDVIVGFPGETEEDFQETLTVLNEVRFSGAFLFKYSPRPGTRAYEYPDSVSEAVKDERLARALQIVNSTVLEENLKYLNTRVSVLVESMDKKGICYTGRNPHNKIVHIFDAKKEDLGQLVEVVISDANGSNLKGWRQLEKK